MGYPCSYDLRPGSPLAFPEHGSPTIGFPREPRDGHVGIVAVIRIAQDKLGLRSLYVDETVDDGHGDVVIGKELTPVGEILDN